MDHQTEDFDFVGVDLQYDPMCLLLQIQSHLDEVYDSKRLQAVAISVVNVFEERYHGKLDTFGQGSMKSITGIKEAFYWDLDDHHLLPSTGKHLKFPGLADE